MKVRATRALLLLASFGLACGRELPLDPAASEAPPAITHPAPAKPERPWNLVLVSIDTLRADHLSAYGYARPTSPALERLAQQGVLFRQAYSHSPKTAPSHMSLFTSLHPEVHRVLNRAGREIDSALSRDVPTLPEMLGRAGYRSAAYTAGGNLHRRIGFGRGFERYEHMPMDAAPTFDAAVRQLREWSQHPDTRPFFLFLHTVQVHDPYLPPASYRERFADPGYDGPIVSDREVIQARARAAQQSPAQAFWRDVDPEDPDDLRHLVDLYDACIRYTDDQIGRMLDALSELGLAAETLVVVLSDHGEEFMEHGGTRHNSLFQELLHVPLILRVPPASGIPAGTRIDPSVRLVDVMPTLLELVGLPVPAHLEGESLVPLMRGEDESPRPVLAHWRERGVRSLRAGRWKLIRIPDDVRLFDLYLDPGERRPLERERTAIAAALARELAKRMDEDLARAATLAPGEPTPLDPETRERLQALGYLE